MKNLTYGEALEAAKKGKLIARSGWNGKGMFVFMRPADELSVDFIVNKVKSLPESVKKYFDCDYVDSDKNNISQSEVKIKFSAYLCLVNTNVPKNEWLHIINGWTASQTDMLSNDWEILE